MNPRVLQENKVISLISNKKVLFIATKNSDYIRIQQEVDLLSRHSKETDFVLSNKKRYLHRLAEVYKKLFHINFKQYDVVFIGFMSQLILPIICHKLRKEKLLIIQDFFISIYDTVVDDRKIIKANSLVSKLVFKLDKFVINASDYIICDTRAHGKYFIDEFGVGEEKVIPYYLSANKKIYYPRVIEKPATWSDKFLVLYFGSILPVQGVNIVIEAANLLYGYQDIQFIVIGPVKDSLKNNNQDNIKYISWLSQKELAKYIAMADICLAGHFSNTIGKADRTIPGKAYIYEAMKKPQILGDSQANKEIEFSNARYCIQGDADALSREIMEAYSESVKR